MEPPVISRADGRATAWPWLKARLRQLGRGGHPGLLLVTSRLPEVVENADLAALDDADGARPCTRSVRAAPARRRSARRREPRKVSRAAGPRRASRCWGAGSRRPSTGMSAERRVARDRGPGGDGAGATGCFRPRPPARHGRR
jgi:hypothetical protein